MVDIDKITVVGIKFIDDCVASQLSREDIAQLLILLYKSMVKGGADNK